jgi:hypothetical protein
MRSHGGGFLDISISSLKNATWRWALFVHQEDSRRKANLVAKD